MGEIRRTTIRCWEESRGGGLDGVGVSGGGDGRGRWELPGTGGKVRVNLRDGD